jgi:hypothetical protein
MPNHSLQHQTTTGKNPIFPSLSSPNTIFSKYVLKRLISVVEKTADIWRYVFHKLRSKSAVDWDKNSVLAFSNAPANLLPRNSFLKENYRLQIQNRLHLVNKLCS